MKWVEEVKWVVQKSRSKSVFVKIIKLVFVILIYYIWLERNERVFGKQRKIGDKVIFEIKVQVLFRVQNCKKMCDFFERQGSNIINEVYIVEDLYED